MNQKYPIGVIVAMSVFYGSMILIMFEAVRSSALVGLALLPPIFLIMYDLTTRLEWNVLHRNKNFTALDGTISVCESGIEPVHGGRSRITITSRKEYIPKDKWFRMGGTSGFLSHLSGKVSHTIIDESWKFIDIKGEDLGADEGAILYLGSLSGKPVSYLDQLLFNKLEDSYSIIRNQQTVFEKAKALASSMARERNLDMLEVQSQFSIILREWQQSLVMPQQQNNQTERRI